MAKYANLSADEIRGHRMLVFRRTVAYIVLILVCIICIFPFVMLLVNTTKDTSTLKTTFSLLPGGDFVRNFTNAINETKVAVLHSMFNSLKFKRYGSSSVHHFNHCFYLFGSDGAGFPLCASQHEYSSHCPIVTHIPWVHPFGKNQLQRT